MVEGEANITLTDVKWKKMTIEGDLNCPSCKGVMSLIPIHGSGLQQSYVICAFCPSCKEYFQAYEHCVSCDEDYPFGTAHTHKKDIEMVTVIESKAVVFLKVEAKEDAKS